jgi:fatty acid desaturase
MGAVQHTLGTFVHEAAHLHLFQHKKLNHIAGHYLCAAPLLSYLEDYRYFHFEHHRHTGKIGRDPELLFYRAMGIAPTASSRGEVVRLFLLDLTGIHYFRGLRYLLSFFQEKRARGVIRRPTTSEHMGLLVWVTLIPGLFWATDLFLPFFLFWLLPLITISPLLLRWHGFGEHVREQGDDAYENTITHKLGVIATLFLYPINSSYHLEHHLFPQIPWYHLRRMHHFALQNPTYREKTAPLTVDRYFLGEASVVNRAFPIVSSDL